ILEEQPQRELEPGRPRARDELRREQRMAAELEEVRVAGDLRHLEHVRPDLGEQRLDVVDVRRRAGRAAGAAATVAAGELRQRFDRRMVEEGPKIEADAEVPPDPPDEV